MWHIMTDLRSSWQAMWQHYDQNVTTSWQACGMEDHPDISVKTLTSTQNTTCKQSQWILISWKLHVLNALFFGARYRLEIYFSCFSMDFHTLGLNDLRLNWLCWFQLIMWGKHQEFRCLWIFRLVWTTVIILGNI